MRIIIILVLSLVIPLTVLSQTSQPTVLVDSVVMGENTLSGEKVFGQRYTMEGFLLKDVYLDSLGHNMAVLVSGLNKKGSIDRKGQFIGYNLERDSVLWWSPMTTVWYDNTQVGETIFRRYDNKYECLDALSGEVLVANGDPIAYFLRKQNIYLTYYSVLSGNKLRARTTQSNKVLWKKELAPPYTWGDLRMVDDSSLLIMSNGVHKFNLFTGEGWGVTTPMGSNDAKANAQATAEVGAGVLLGALTGFFMIPMGAGDYAIKDLRSNLVNVGDTIMFASSEKISCLNGNGAEYWSTLLPKDFLSTSRLMLDDSVAYLVNYGRATMARKDDSHGVPFISAYNRADGFMRFHTNMESKILDFELDYLNDQIYLLFKDRIACYSLSKGELVKDKVFDVDVKPFVGFVRKDIYLPSADLMMYKNFLQLYPEQSLFLKRENEVIVLDTKFTEIDRVNLSEAYLWYGSMGDYELLGRKDKTVVINMQQRVVAKLDAPYNSWIRRGALFVFRDKECIRVDASHFLPIVQDEFDLNLKPEQWQ